MTIEIHMPDQSPCNRENMLEKPDFRSAWLVEIIFLTDKANDEFFLKIEALAKEQGIEINHVDDYYYQRINRRQKGV